LKHLIHKGVPDFRRRQAWQAVIGVTEFNQRNPDFYKRAMHRTFGDRLETSYHNFPTFGGKMRPSDYYLTLEGVEVAKRILYVVGHEHSELTHAAPLPDMVAICLHYMNEPEAYLMLHLMISASQKSKHYFFNLTQKASKSFLKNLGDLVKQHHPKLANHMKSLNVRVNDFAEDWFNRLFISYLPYQTSLRVLDVYINEGSKVLLTVGLGLLQMYSEVLCFSETLPDFLKKPEKSRG